MPRPTHPPPARPAGALGLTLALAGLACGQPAAWETVRSRAARAVLPPLAVRLAAQPALVFQPEVGATRVRLAYGVRHADGSPVDANAFVARLEVDGRPVDCEASAHVSADEVEGGVTFSLVLDATYSLVAGGEGPFAAMRQAARAAVVAGAERVRAAGPQAFTWALTWFDDAVYTPVGAWEVDDILRLPAPCRGSFTRLRSAVAHRLEAAEAERGEMATPWRHVMVLFSDGADNHSNIDLPARNDTALLPGPGPVRTFAAQTGRAVGEAALLARVREARSLTLHTIGIGAADGEARRQLAALAEAGGGTHQDDVTADNLDRLFLRVAEDLASVRTFDALLPEAAGDYDLVVQVEPAPGVQAAPGALSLRVRLGDAGAQVLGAP